MSFSDKDPQSEGPATAAQSAMGAGLGTSEAVLQPLDHAVFRNDKMGKSTLFHSERLLIGLNCFEPGQQHAAHVHATMDKMYHVVSGKGVYLYGDDEVPMTQGDLLLAPAGIAHGIRNDSGERLVVLAVLAPAP